MFAPADVEAAVRWLQGRDGKRRIEPLRPGAVAAELAGLHHVAVPGAIAAVCVQQAHRDLLADQALELEAHAGREAIERELERRIDRFAHHHALGYERERRQRRLDLEHATTLVEQCSEVEPREQFGSERTRCQARDRAHDSRATRLRAT